MAQFARVDLPQTLLENGTSTSPLDSVLEFVRFNNAGGFIGKTGGLGSALRATCKTALHAVDKIFLSRRLHAADPSFNPRSRHITEAYELIAVTHARVRFDWLDLSDGLGDRGPPGIGPIIPHCCVAGINADYLNIMNCRTNGNGDFSAMNVRELFMAGSTDIFKAPHSAVEIIAHDSNLNEIPKNRVIKIKGQPDQYVPGNLLRLDVCSSFYDLDVANSVLSLQEVDCRGDILPGQLGYLQACDIRYMRSDIDFILNLGGFLHLRALHNGSGKGVPEAPSLQQISFIEYAAEDMRDACAQLKEKCPDLRVIECNASGYIREVETNLLQYLPTNMDAYSIHLDKVMTPEAEQDWIEFLEDIYPDTRVVINCYTMEFDDDDDVVVWRTAAEVLAAL